MSKKKQQVYPILHVPMQYFDLIIDAKRRILRSPKATYLRLSYLLDLEIDTNNAWAQIVAECVAYDTAKAMSDKYSLRHSFIHYVAQFANPAPTTRYVSELIGLDANCIIAPKRQRDFAFFQQLKQLADSTYIDKTAYVCKQVWRNGVACILPLSVSCGNDYDLVLFDCQNTEITDHVETILINGVECSTLKHLIATHDDVKALIFDQKT